MRSVTPAVSKSVATGFLVAALMLSVGVPVRALESDVRATLESSLQPIINGTWRSEQNRARDRYRHPAQTLAFFNVKPDVTLIEITPGTGWYAEILAPLLKGHGLYYAAIAAPAKTPPEQRDYQAQARTRLTEKFQADSQRYAAAQIIEFDPAAPDFGKANSADIVVTFRNVHNWAKSGTEAAYFRAFFNVLRPGGILGIEDHRAKAGTPLNLDSGYLPENYVIELATAAGFKLVARSEINANPADTKDYPKGVWTLPPTYILGEQDKEKYQAIGESDRFTLSFIKPAS